MNILNDDDDQRQKICFSSAINYYYRIDIQFGSNCKLAVFAIITVFPINGILNLPSKTVILIGKMGCNNPSLTLGLVIMMMMIMLMMMMMLMMMLMLMKIIKIPGQSRVGCFIFGECF